jgi:hypothetical protein
MMRRRKTIVGQLAKINAKQRGFTLPLSIGVGISMLLLGSLMIARSNVDQGTAIAQVQTAGALSVAEAGVARTLSMLNSPNNARLLTLNYESDRGDGREYLGDDQILRSGDELATISNQWDDPAGGCTTPTGASFAALVSGTVGTGTDQGNYRVLAYRYRPATEVASLLVEGTFRGSTSRVQVSFNTRTRTSSGSNGFPGLYALNSINLGNNDVLKVVAPNETGSSANIICRDCVVTNPATSCSASTGQPTNAAISAAIGQGPNGVIDGRAMIQPLDLPPVPTPPASGAQGRYEIGAIGAGTTFPRSDDVADANGVYHYMVNSITLNGSNTVTINSTTGRVRFYVSGDVTLSGNAGIQHTGTPDRFAIFGTGGVSQSITISGGASTTSAFIHAPNATVGINGGSSDPDVKGAVWARVWNGSNSNNAEIRVPDNMPELLRSAFGSSFDLRTLKASTAPTSWSREGAVLP